jgi:hypothetical protein
MVAAFNVLVITALALYCIKTLRYVLKSLRRDLSGAPAAIKEAAAKIKAAREAEMSCKKEA